MNSMTVAHTPTEVSDEELAEAARAGDREAFARLTLRYREIAYAYACARLRHREEAEDIVQEAFVRAFQALPRFSRRGRWAAWMMSILRNLCTDSLRRRRRQPTEPLDHDWATQDASPELATLGKAQQEDLRRAIASLPEKYRTPLLMHYVSQRAYREIALALGLPESTVVGRLAGALRLLRRRLCQEGGR